MSISEIYALADLMGLHLSSSPRHERAYLQSFALGHQWVPVFGLHPWVPAEN